jgi:Cu/Zn superoxide dismutase
VKLALITLLVAGLAAGNLASAQDTKAKSAKKGAKSVTVKLSPQNKSGESGTARLTPQGDQTKVEITLKGAPKGVAQPAHIHDGTCAKLDPKPKHGLENVVDGKSTTTLPVKLDALLSGGRTAINVHKSTDDIKTYVACGNIRPAGAAKKGESKKATPKA